MIVHLAGRVPRAKGLQFSGNLGQFDDITACLDRSESDAMVVTGEQPAGLTSGDWPAPSLAWKRHDLMLTRRGQHNDSAPARTMPWIFYRMSHYLADMDCGGAGNFCIEPCRVVECFRLMREHLRFFGGMIIGLPGAPAFISARPLMKPNG